MIFSKFRFVCTLRVLLITCTVFLLILLLEHTAYIVTTAIVAVILIAQIFSLINYVEKTNIKVSQFLESIRYSDFTASFSPSHKGKSFDELNKAFNEVINEFRKTRKAKEEHFNYLQTVVQHVRMGIIVFQSDGCIDLANNTFRKMLKIGTIKNIKDLYTIDEQLTNALLSIQSDQNELIKITLDNELLQLSIYATEFKMRGEHYKLVSLQNIHYELEEKEMESWQKLTRVLTHEIMNSITPISSLASTVKEMITDEDGKALDIKQIDDETIDNIQSALATIERRSKGLLNFVDIYRNLTRIPKANFKHFYISEVFERVYDLQKNRIKELNIKFEMQVLPPKLMLLADPDLIEQVLINLVINAIHANEGIENPIIYLMAEDINGKIFIHVVDNGKGIKPDLMEKIFIPFFTSKKDGSGIGLSLSRQIMFMHKGSISARSNPGLETRFTLKF